MESIALVYAVGRGAKLLVGEDPDRIAPAQLDARSRHKLRIQAKKLGYAAEFFVSLFAQKRAVKRREQFLDAYGDFRMDSATLTTSRFTKSVLQ
jgi:triphosphatase